MTETGVHKDFLGVFGLLQRGGSLLLAGNRRVLQPGQPPTRVFDLPGGEVEPGETLEEALRRECQEELGLGVEVGAFLFVQEGLRRMEGVRKFCWRSFFFRLEAKGTPRPAGEVESLLWCPRERLEDALRAPYHGGFLRWLRSGEPYQFDLWPPLISSPGASGWRRRGPRGRS